jgi:hypothetical protein
MNFIFRFLSEGNAAVFLRREESYPDTALPLLVEYSEADICLNIGRERILGAFPTPLNDFESRP